MVSVMVPVMVPAMVPVMVPVMMPVVVPVVVPVMVSVMVLEIGVKMRSMHWTLCRIYLENDVLFPSCMLEDDDVSYTIVLDISVVSY